MFRSRVSGTSSAAVTNPSSPARTSNCGRESARGYAMRNLPETLVDFRVHDGSVTTRHRVEGAAKRAVFLGTLASAWRRCRACGWPDTWISVNYPRLFSRRRRRGIDRHTRNRFDLPPVYSVYPAAAHVGDPSAPGRHVDTTGESRSPPPSIGLISLPSSVLVDPVMSACTATSYVRHLYELGTRGSCRCSETTGASGWPIGLLSALVIAGVSREALPVVFPTGGYPGAQCGCRPSPSSHRGSAAGIRSGRSHHTDYRALFRDPVARICPGRLSVDDADLPASLICGIRARRKWRVLASARGLSIQLHRRVSALPWPPADSLCAASAGSGTPKPARSCSVAWYCALFSGIRRFFTFHDHPSYAA